MKFFNMFRGGLCFAPENEGGAGAPLNTSEVIAKAISEQNDDNKAGAQEAGAGGEGGASGEADDKGAGDGSDKAGASDKGEGDAAGGEGSAAGGEGNAEGDGKAGKEGSGASDEEVEVKGIGKLKLSDLKAALDTHKKAENWTKKFQDLSEKEKQVQALAGFGEILKSKPGLMKRFLKLALEEGDGDSGAGDDKAKAASMEKVKQEIGALLGDLDVENDPYAKAMKNLADKILNLGQEIEAAKTEAKTRDQRSENEATVRTLRNTLSDVRKDLKLDGDEGSERFGVVKNLILADLQANHKEYKDTEEFAKAIKEAGKRVQTQLDKIGEARLADFLKSKKKPGPPAGSGGGAAEKTTAVKYDGSNLSEVLLAEVKAKRQEKEAK